MSENDARNEAFNQSLEVNRILLDLQKEKGKSQRAPWICCAIVSVCMTIVVVSLLFFFSRYEFYAEETTITQDTANGGGNNVYLEGEYAHYYEADELEDINGETNS